MYDVVGCGQCSTLWIRSGEAATATCPRCGKRHQVDRLKPLAQAATADGAREARTQLLAERGADNPDAIAGFAEIAEAASEPIVSEVAHMKQAGVDVDAVSAAGERATTTPRVTPRADRIKRILDEHAPVSRSVLIDAAEKEGIEPSVTRDILEKLTQRGAVLEMDDGYRLL